MPTDDQLVIDKLSEELNQLWEKYRLALESDEIFEVRKEIRMKIKEISGQIITIRQSTSSLDQTPPASS